MKRCPWLALLFTLASCVAKDLPLDSSVAQADLRAPEDLSLADFAWDPPDFTFVHYDAGSPPIVRCGGDASARDGAVECPPPPSECAPDEPHTMLIYYTNGRCVNGQCAWDRKFMDCFADEYKVCRQGGCEYQLTM